jgi:transcriptional regulator with XRE-family HTH domain
MSRCKSSEFANWLVKAIQARGVSAGQLARDAKISRAAAYFYCKGERVPSISIAMKLARQLGMPLRSLPVYELPKRGRPRRERAR